MTALTIYFLENQCSTISVTSVIAVTSGCVMTCVAASGCHRLPAGSGSRGRQRGRGTRSSRRRRGADWLVDWPTVRLSGRGRQCPWWRRASRLSPLNRQS